MATSKSYGKVAIVLGLFTNSLTPYNNKTTNSQQ